MNPSEDDIPPQSEWDHDILAEQSEAEWLAFQRDLERDWRLP